jgi:hypothetical protein
VGDPDDDKLEDQKWKPEQVDQAQSCPEKRQKTQGVREKDPAPHKAQDNEELVSDYGFEHSSRLHAHSRKLILDCGKNRPPPVYFSFIQ